ncbi:MAG: AAA family ATPase [Acetobacteraceae bacterium]|nr:AAA family ATPase [Acetobacteraceae bacterium]
MANSRRRRISPGIPLTDAHRTLFASVQKRGAQSVCFFNNKGGVGKTTLVANLGAELSLNFEARVLVVDADPQCNLTQYVLGDEEVLETYNNSNDPESVYSVIRPLSLGKGYGTNLPIRQSEAFGFDIIIGDPRLALQEDLLASDWKDARGGGMRGIRTTFVFADLVSKAKDLKYDFILFDMGPSLGAINRSVLLAMDFFVVPMSIDVFSSWAIRNIGNTINIWQRELKTGIALAEDPAELESIDRTRTIRFLGYVTQQHRERTEEDADLDVVESDEASETRRKRIVQAYEEISEKFPEQISDSLGRFLDCVEINPFLGNVRHLGSLAPKSQSQHSPMISVRGTGRFVQSRKQAREIYRDIARRYLENLEKFLR